MATDAAGDAICIQDLFLLSLSLYECGCGGRGEGAGGKELQNVLVCAANVFNPLSPFLVRIPAARAGFLNHKFLQDNSSVRFVDDFCPVAGFPSLSPLSAAQRQAPMCVAAAILHNYTLSNQKMEEGGGGSRRRGKRRVEDVMLLGYY